MTSPAAGVGARELAARVLERVERDRAFADVTLDAALAASPLDARDRAFATKLVYGTLAWRGRLDWHLRALAEREPSALDPIVRIVLHLGLYQVLMLDRVPTHAAVATSVDVAKRVAPAASGLVNAVLRRAVRERDRLTVPDPSVDPIEHLAIALSHPHWLVERWRTRFGMDELRALLAANNEAAPTVVRARHGERDTLLATFRARGITAEPCRFAPDGVRVAAVAPHEIAGLGAGDFAVQSEASQLVTLLMGVEPGMHVLDACAAPGGKTGYLADLMDGRGSIVALDRRRRGAAKVKTGARRLGAPNIAVAALDARHAAQALRGTFDRILVDAPCSGFGTLRSHPEVRWTRTPEDVGRLANLQREILDGVVPLLRPGGSLVYATCTMMPEENERLVEAWLTAHPDLRVESATAFLPAAAAGLVDEAGALRPLPHRDDLDGFYAVRVRRSTG